MKKIKINGMISLVFALLIPQAIRAQGISYISNLNQPSNDSLVVGSNSWVAADFKTGNNATGYYFDSVQLAMAGISEDPSGFIAMLYSQATIFGGLIPGNSLGTLDGSDNPSTDGVYTYTSASGLMLLPNTYYFIILTAETSVDTGAYEWSYTGASSYSSLDGWSASPAYYYSVNGSSWNASAGIYPQFAITATPIPEPLPSWLFLLGSGFFFYVRRIHRN